MFLEIYEVIEADLGIVYIFLNRIAIIVHESGEHKFTLLPETKILLVPQRFTITCRYTYM